MLSYYKRFASSKKAFLYSGMIYKSHDPNFLKMLKANKLLYFSKIHAYQKIH